MKLLLKRSDNGEEKINTMSNVFISEKAQWKRPYTSQRYLQAPFSEVLISMWPDGKITFNPIDTKTSVYDLQGSAFKILVGKEYNELDFKKVKYRTNKEGIPVHGFSHRIGNLKLDMESFASVERNPITYTKIKLSNLGKQDLKENLAITARSGKIRTLTGTETSLYSHRNTNIGNWGFVPTYFAYENNVMADKNVVLVFQGIENLSARWQGNVKGLPWHQRGLLDLTVSLKSGEEKIFYIAFLQKDKHMLVDFDYEKEKVKVEQFWQRELAKIHTYPYKNKRKYYTLVRSLVANCLQMFAYPLNENFVIPRQGAMQMGVWPGEAVWMFRALDRIGDFSKYTQKVFDDFYIKKLYISEGEDKGKYEQYEYAVGTRWASSSSAIMAAMAWHSYYKTQKEFDKYKEYIYSTFCWLARQREMTKNDKFPAKGLFPPARSCDWEEVFQTWTKTDNAMLMNCEIVVKVFEKYNDVRSKKLREIYNDYMSCMRTIFEDITKRYSDGDELRIPMHVGRDFEEPQQEGPFISDGISLVASGVCPSDSEYVQQIKNYYHNRCIVKNGLHGLMNTGLLPYREWDPWAGHVWYTNTVDRAWFKVCLQRGELDEAKETLDAQLKYSMTKEYQMLERYADNDPYFTPYMPNASANGRTLEMLYGYCEKINEKN